MDQLGQYRIEARLGSGTIGTLHRARDSKTGRAVLLKVLPSHVSQNQRFLEAFRCAVARPASLEGPHLLVARGLGEADGRCYIELDYADGRLLDEELRGRGRLRPREAMLLLRDALSAIACLHEAGNIHGDIKTCSFLMDAEGHVGLLDSGLPEGLAAEALAITVPGQAPVRIEYTSPEECEGKPPSTRSDLYSLGVIAYELVAGARPFDAASPADTVGRILAGTHPPLAEKAPDAPPQLVRWIEEGLLARDPTRRVPTARKALEDLEAILGGLPDEAMPPSARRLRRRPRAFVALAIALSLAGWVAWRWGSRLPLLSSTEAENADARKEWEVDLEAFCARCRRMDMAGARDSLSGLERFVASRDSAGDPIARAWKDEVDAWREAIEGLPTVPEEWPNLTERDWNAMKQCVAKARSMAERAGSSSSLELAREWEGWCEVEKEAYRAFRSAEGAKAQGDWAEAAHSYAVLSSVYQRGQWDGKPNAYGAAADARRAACVQEVVRALQEGVETLRREGEFEKALAEIARTKAKVPEATSDPSLATIEAELGVAAEQSKILGEVRNLLARGEYETAKDRLQRVQAPDFEAETRLLRTMIEDILRAREAYGAGRAEEAAGLLSPYVRGPSPAAEALFEKAKRMGGEFGEARKAEERGDFVRAAQVWRHILEMEPDTGNTFHVEASRALERIQGALLADAGRLLAEGKWRDAANLHRQVRNLFPGSQEARTGLQRVVDHVLEQFRTLRADRLLALSERMRQVHDLLNALSPEDEGYGSVEEYLLGLEQEEKLLKEADQAAAEARWADAIEGLARVLDLDPGNGDARVRRCAALLRLGEPTGIPRAVDDFQRALSGQPDALESVVAALQARLSGPGTSPAPPIAEFAAACLTRADELQVRHQGQEAQLLTQALVLLLQDDESQHEALANAYSFLARLKKELNDGGFLEDAVQAELIWPTRRNLNLVADYVRQALDRPGDSPRGYLDAVYEWSRYESARLDGTEMALNPERVAELLAEASRIPDLGERRRKLAEQAAAQVRGAAK